MEGEGGMSSGEQGSRGSGRSGRSGRSTAEDLPEEREPETEGHEDHEPEPEGHEGHQDHEESGESFSQADPDVLLDVPKIHVDELNLGVDDLKARVALRTRLSELLEIEVGLDVSLQNVKLETKGVEAEAQLKARLENVESIIERTLDSVDENPEIIKDLAEMSEASPQGPGSGESATLQSADEGREDSKDTGEQGEPEDPADPQDDSKPRAPRATEAAERKAEELGLDVTSVEGTGSGGRVILRDVRRAGSG